MYCNIKKFLVWCFTNSILSSLLTIVLFIFQLDEIKYKIYSFPKLGMSVFKLTYSELILLERIKESVEIAIKSGFINLEKLDKNICLNMVNFSLLQNALGLVNKKYIMEVSDIINKELKYIYIVDINLFKMVGLKKFKRFKSYGDYYHIIIG